MPSPLPSALPRPLRTCLKAVALATLPALPVIAQDAAQEAAQSCAALGADAGSGLYVFAIQDHGAMQVYCDNEMVANGRRGGWMLAWSNLRGGAGDPATDLGWFMSLHTPPRYNGVLPVGTAQAERQFFEVYTGLDWWVRLADAAKGAEMVYEWAADYSPDRRIDQRAVCDFRLDPADKYRIFFDQPTCQQLKGGGGLPGLFSFHTGKPWTTMDADSDSHAEINCAHNFGRTPFWYERCWSGSINGGGEVYGDSYVNGAYWTSSHKRFANPVTASDNATGAGSGWIYIRPDGAGH